MSHENSCQCSAEAAIGVFPFQPVRREIFLPSIFLSCLLSRFIGHTKLKAMQWVNVSRKVVMFMTIKA
jgi:hypothetical protein